MAKTLENIPYTELEIGQSAERTFKITRAIINDTANLFHDGNPAHMCDAFAQASMFGEVIAHGMLNAGYISGVIGEVLPGPGTIYLGQNLDFKNPVRIGDEITVHVEVLEKIPGKKEGTGKAVLKTICTNQDGDVVVEGQATVLAPTQKIKHEELITRWGDPER